jgi:NAD(P)-dependent dehydrogenase (short-subunit alcohol dehydrogenase family)
MTWDVSKGPEVTQKEFEVIALQRWGGEGDIAGVIVTLASRAGAFITGEVIPVDGAFKWVASFRFLSLTRHGYELRGSEWRLPC